jgi:twitching motility protein PilJ
VQANAKKIKRLGDRSMEISGMVKVIGDISAQTDMLAFNASIEASRAGEQGRGFSVVAEQVRALAEKTKALTDQIDKLVRDTQAETAEAVTQMEVQTQIVEGGAGSAAAAGDILTNIVAASGQSSEAVARISQAASLQAQRTGEMLIAIGDIGQIVSETQEKVGATRTTSSDLTLLSSELDRQLSQFAVGQN